MMQQYADCAENVYGTVDSAINKVALAIDQSTNLLTTVIENMRLLQADYVDYVRNIRQNCGTATEQEGVDLVTGTAVWATIPPVSNNSQL